MKWDGPDGYWISDDPSLINVDLVHNWISRESYWARGRAHEVMARSIEHSLVLGLYTSDGEQVGFARQVTDRATFAWLCDVFVLEPYRGRGLSKWLIECVMGHPDMHGLRRLLLGTRDAHGLYQRYGFTQLADPARFMEVLRPDVCGVQGTT